jgi:hypothetical protein
MAHFYSTVASKNSQQTKCGHGSSGMNGHLRGWNIGCRVDLKCVDGKDVVTVYKTYGSHAQKAEEKIAEYSE